MITALTKSLLYQKFTQGVAKLPKIERTLVEGERFYTVNGLNAVFPSVTTVLSIVKKHKLDKWEQTIVTSKIRTEILKWADHPDWRLRRDILVDTIIQGAVDVPNTRRETAIEFGNIAHELLDELIKGNKPFVPEKYRNLVLGFEKWKRDSKLHLISPETFVYSKAHQYAGAMDAVGLFIDTDGSEKLVAIDWKTTNELRPEHGLQVAAYAKALQEMLDVPVNEAWVIRFDKTGRLTYNEFRLADVNVAFDKFEAALKLWKTYRNTEEDFSLWRTQRSI